MRILKYLVANKVCIDKIKVIFSKRIGFFASLQNRKKSSCMARTSWGNLKKNDLSEMLIRITPHSSLDSQDMGFLRIASTTSVKRAVLSMSMRFNYHANSSLVLQKSSDANEMRSLVHSRSVQTCNTPRNPFLGSSGDHLSC